MEVNIGSNKRIPQPGIAIERAKHPRKVSKVTTPKLNVGVNLFAIFSHVMATPIPTIEATAPTNPQDHSGIFNTR